MKFVIFSALLTGATAFAPPAAFSRSTALFQVIGSGGMADTRDPGEYQDEDPRKSISAAPSFEEYLKQRAAAEAGTPTAPAAAASAAAAPAASAPAPVTAAPAASGGPVVDTLSSLQGPGEEGGADGRASPEEAIATLDASQAASVEAIAAAIPDLDPKPDCTWDPGSGVSIAGCPTTLDARDAPGPSNIAWLSSLCVASKLSALTIFNGPLTDVPHLLSRCVIVGDNTLAFTLDFRPRAYGAYEMVDAAGNYPGPDVLGRKSFEYSGARADFNNKFGNDEVVAFMGSTAASFEGAAPSTVPPSEFDMLTRGPLAMSVTMPLTDGNVASIAAARAKAAEYWLGWALDEQHAHRPGAPVNTQYVYDSKYKQNAYSALLHIYSEFFGATDGAKLAAADSGPLDEGYVGGGS